MESDNILFRCSSLGKLMTEPQGKSNAEKYADACVSLGKYQSDFENMQNKETKTAAKKLEQIEKTKQLIAELEPIKNKVELSETCKAELLKVFIYYKYNRTKAITSKYFEKGIVCEEDSITLLSRVTQTMYIKNEVRLKNDYITGIPDLFKGKSIETAEYVPDVKTSWDIYTFFDSKTKPLNSDYYWQDLGYLWLTGAKKGSINHCLVNTPDGLIENEKKSFLYKNPGLSQEQIDEAFAEIDRNSKYDDILIQDKVHTFEIERNNDDIERIRLRIIDCRQYIRDTFNF